MASYKLRNLLYHQLSWTSAHFIRCMKCYPQLTGIRGLEREKSELWNLYLLPFILNHLFRYVNYVLFVAKQNIIFLIFVWFQGTDNLLGIIIANTEQVKIFMGFFPPPHKPIGLWDRLCTHCKMGSHATLVSQNPSAILWPFWSHSLGSAWIKINFFKKNQNWFFI